MAKTRANISVDEDVLAVARDHRLNVSSIAEEAICKAGKMAQAEAWKRDNAHVLAARIERLEKHGTLLADIAAFQLPPELK